MNYKDIVHRLSIKDYFSNSDLLHKWIAFGLSVFLISLYVLPKSRIINNLFYVGVLLPVVMLFVNYRIRLLAHKHFSLLALTLIFFATSTWWGNQAGVQYFLHNLRYCVYIFAYIIALGLLYQREENFWNVIKFVLVASAIGLSINVWFWLTSNAAARLYGTVSFHNSVDLGVSYGFATLLALGCALQCPRHRWMVGLILVYLLIGTLLTETKTALLGLSFGAVIMLFGSNRPKNFLIGFCVVVVIILVAAQFGLLDRLLTMKLGRETPRVLIWMEIWETVSNTGALWFGIGYDRDYRIDVEALGRTFSTAHSQYAGSFLLGGLIGLALMCSIVGTSLWLSLKTAFATTNFFPLALMAYGAICSLAHGTRLLGRPQDNWLYWWFPIALILSTYLSISHKKQNSKAATGCRDSAVPKK